MEKIVLSVTLRTTQEKTQTVVLFQTKTFFFFQAETNQIKWLLNEPYSEKIENDPNIKTYNSNKNKSLN